MNITAKTKICMVIGDPIEHSLSPQMHNRGYEKLSIDNEYVFIACNVKVENISDFMKGIKAMGIRGVSCTIPHKMAVLEYLDEIDDTAKAIGAVNTIVSSNGVLKGYNTDWLGAVAPLEKVTTLKNKKVALLGAGGAARAIVFGLMKKGAQVTIFNRSLGKAKLLAKEFGCKAASLDEISQIKDMDIIINATSVGLNAHNDETPLDKAFITNKHIVFDIIYAPFETRLLLESKEQGAKIIHGLEMLFEQGIAQFKLYTNMDAPEEAMRSVLLESLGVKEKK